MSEKEGVHADTGGWGFWEMAGRKAPIDIHHTGRFGDYSFTDHCVEDIFREWKVF